MQAGLVEFADDFAEQDVDFVLAFENDGVEAEGPGEGEEDRHEEEAGEECDDGGGSDGGKISHGWPSGSRGGRR